MNQTLAAYSQTPTFVEIERALINNDLTMETAVQLALEGIQEANRH
jgi:hypothetical protein